MNPDQKKGIRARGNMVRLHVRVRSNGVSQVYRGEAI
jgi:hypothetical protein